MVEGQTCKSMLESIEAIDENVEYINKIVSDRQDFTRPLNLHFEEVNLNDLITSTVAMLKIPATVETLVDVNEAIKLKTDVVLLKRAISNLVLNAMQAMEHGGKLEIHARSLEGKNVIIVKDSGNGISEEVKQKTFTPLFTTKSKGQGLGLSVVKRLVEALGGSIRVESVEGNGANFMIELPAEP